MKKRRLGFWEIWNMSFGFLGIQMGFALQNANTSRIFETLGAPTKDLAVYWLAAPVTGLLIQPIVGYFSDRTWHPKWGRRRPYFMIGAIFASLALLMMPNAPSLWVAVGTLWIMDSSINISMEPFRAFVGDNLPEEQRTKGFAMQSFFIGSGAVVGSILPWVFSNWFGTSSEAPGGVIPDQVKYSFYIGAIAFFGAVMWTVFKSKEYPPEQLEAFEDNREEEPDIPNEASVKQRIRKLKKYGWSMTLMGLVLNAVLIYLIWNSGVQITEIEQVKSLATDQTEIATLAKKVEGLSGLRKEFYKLFILTGGILLIGSLFLIASEIRKKGRNGFTIIMGDLLYMPRTMQQLTYVQFFSWFALFSMWIYTTSAVTSRIYGTTDTTSELYNEGADWVAFLFGVYNGVAAGIALFLPMMAKKTSRKITHLFCLSLGGSGLLSIGFFNGPIWLLLSMVGVGFAWASILSVPYAMLAGALPANKMGYFMGVFNYFIVIPQIVAASVLGFMLFYFFDSKPIYALIIGGLSMILSGLLTLRVSDKADIKIAEHNND